MRVTHAFQTAFAAVLKRVELCEDLDESLLQHVFHFVVVSDIAHTHTHEIPAEQCEQVVHRRGFSPAKGFCDLLFLVDDLHDGNTPMVLMSCYDPDLLLDKCRKVQNLA